MLNKFTFLRRKKFEFNIKDHCKSLIEKIKWIETELENWEQKLELIPDLWKMTIDNCEVLKIFELDDIASPLKQMKKSWQQTFKTR